MKKLQISARFLLLACISMILLSVTIVFVCDLKYNSNLRAEPAAGIFGTNYYWADSMAISTTEIDTAFAEEWQDVTLWSSGCNIYIKAACNNDTTNFINREYVYLISGQSINFSNATKLKRLAIVAAAGSGVLYSAGYKKTSQY